MALDDFLTAFNNDRNNAFTIDPLNSFLLKIDFKTEMDPDVPEFLDNIKEAKISMDTGIVDFTLFTQSITMPKIIASSATAVTSIVGNINTYSTLVRPSEPAITMSIINTKYPLIENVFLPWINEVKSNRWKYKNHPYTKADIHVILEHAGNIEYKLFGVRPVSIDLFNPSQDLPGKPVRNVTFDFDFIRVDGIPSSAVKSIGSMFKDFGKKLINKGLGSIGL